MYKILNIAAIAHVDAGKSTLVDSLLNAYQKTQGALMDSNVLEKERGITIYSKNCAIQIADTKINIVDTPGHADFSSEVERIIQTVDTVILLVDCVEGPMPQTKFVLSKALQHNLNPIVIINKIDKEDQRIQEVIEEIYDMFFELGANDHQIDFPILYGITKEGSISKTLEPFNRSLKDLEESLLASTPYFNDDPALEFQVSSLGYDNYLGRLGIGRVFSGTLQVGDRIRQVRNDGTISNAIIKKLFVYSGTNRVSVESVQSGDIAMVVCDQELSIGDTLCDMETLKTAAPIPIEKPTLSMNFGVNTSPFAGKEGVYLTSRKLHERLMKELQINVGLEVYPTQSPNVFKVLGRGLLHLSILIENMRREGLEFEVSNPEVVSYEENGKIYEPYETLELWMDPEYSGIIIEFMGKVNGNLEEMDESNNRLYQKWYVASRHMIGFHEWFITQTRGSGTMTARFKDFAPRNGTEIQKLNGVLISKTAGTSMAFPMFHLQQRGHFSIPRSIAVYQGMVIGFTNQDFDLAINVTRNKRLNSFRGNGNGGKEDALKLKDTIQLSLEGYMSVLRDDMLLEVTPHNLRMRLKNLNA